MPKEKKPVTTKRGQHHRYKSFMMNLVKDNSIEKVDTNVLRKHQESFEKKKVTFEKRNDDPAHFHDTIIHEFQTLGGVEFSLWRLSKDNPNLLPLPSRINNAVALCDYDELNRSSIYIRLVAAPCEPNSNQPISSDDGDGISEQDMSATTYATQQSELVFQNVYSLTEMQPAVKVEFNSGQDELLKTVVSVGNERKRKHFSDSEDQVPSKSAVNTEEDEDHEVARFMASVSTLKTHADYKFQLPKLRKIGQMDRDKMRTKTGYDVAVLNDRLYLVGGPHSIYVHRNDSSFKFIWEATIYSALHYWIESIAASSAHNRCYFLRLELGLCKIWYLTNDSQMATVFLEPDEWMSDMTVTASGDLLVLFRNGKLETYNANGECTESIFINNYNGNTFCAVKTNENTIVHTACAIKSSIAFITERSVDGSESRFPFATDEFGIENPYFFEMTLGEDGQVFIRDRLNGILLYDLRTHQLRTLLANKDHQIQSINGFCYCREKKQLLLICDFERVVIFQLSQNDECEPDYQSSSEKNLFNVQHKGNLPGIETEMWTDEKPVTSKRGQQHKLRSLIAAPKSEPDSNQMIPSDDDKDGEESEHQMDAITDATKQTASVLENVPVMPQSGDNEIGYSSFEIPVVVERNINGELLLLPVNVGHLSTAELQQPGSSFQVGQNYGGAQAIDQSLNPEVVYSDFQMDVSSIAPPSIPSQWIQFSQELPIMTQVVSSSNIEFPLAQSANYSQTLHSNQHAVAATPDNVAKLTPRVDVGFQGQYYFPSNPYGTQMAPTNHHSQFPIAVDSVLAQNFMPSRSIHYDDHPPNSSHLSSQQMFQPVQNSIYSNNNLNDTQYVQHGFNLTVSNNTSGIPQTESIASNSSTNQLNDIHVEVQKAELIGGVKDCRSNIKGISVLKEKLYMIYGYGDSEILTVHSSSSPFEKIIEHKIEGMKKPVQISASSKKTLLYILDGKDSEPKCIWIITDSDEFTAKKCLEDVSCCSLAVTNEGDLVLLDNKNRCLHLYKSENGRCFRCIHLKEISKEEFGEPHFVICSSDNHFYISSSDEKTERSMICKVSDKGKLLKTFGGRNGKGLGQFSSSSCPLLTLDKYGRVIVCDSGNNRVLLLNSDLEYMTTVSYCYRTVAMCCGDSDCMFMVNGWMCNAFDISQFTPDKLIKIAYQKSLKISDADDEMRLMGSIFTKDESPGSIRGVAVLFDKIYLLTSKNILVHSALNPFKQILQDKDEDEDNADYADFWDIAADDNGVGRLYVTDKANHCIWWMGIDLNKKKWLQKTGSPYTLSISKDGSVIIPNNKLMSIDIYEGKTAKRLHRISLSENFNRRKFRHAVKLGDGFVICIGYPREEFDDSDDDVAVNQVLIVSSNGDVIRSREEYVGKYYKTYKLNLPNHLTIDRRGRIFVADWKNNRVLSLNQQFELKKTLLSNKKQGIVEPRRLCYDEKSDRLFVCCSQSVDIFRCSDDLQCQATDDRQLLRPKSPDSDGCGFKMPNFHKINQMTEQMVSDRSCHSVAMLSDELYLIYDKVESVYVHQSHSPFDFIREIHVMGFYDGYRCRPSIVASSVQNRCYIKAYSKIWYLTSGSHTAELFLGSEEEIHSMSVTASGELLVVYHRGKLAIYNAEGECTECVFVNRTDYKYYVSCGVKTIDDRFIYAVREDVYYDDSSIVRAIYERSADGKESCIFGPFEYGDEVCCLFSLSEISLGEDGQVFILGENGGNLLLYDYRAKVLRTRVIKDNLKASKVTGFCYSREMKQLLLVCGSEEIVFLQLSQNNGRGLDSSINRSDLFEHEDEEKQSDRLLYSLRCEMYESIRGIARLEQHTYILYDSQLWTLNSKEMRVKTLDDNKLNTFQIPEDGSNLKTGGLWDIGASHFDLCVYITDKENRCIWSVTIDHKVKRWSKEDIDSPFTLFVDDEGDVIVPSNFYRHLDVFDSNGIRKKSIRLPRQMIYVIRAVQTPTGNFVILWSEKNLDDDDHKIVLEKLNRSMQSGSQNEENVSKDHLSEIDSDGNLIRTINCDELMPSLQQPIELRHLTFHPDGRIFVFDISSEGRVLLLDNQLKVLENLSTKPLCRKRDAIIRSALCYDNTTKQLLVLFVSLRGYQFACFRV